MLMEEANNDVSRRTHHYDGEGSRIDASYCKSSFVSMYTCILSKLMVVQSVFSLHKLCADEVLCVPSLWNHCQTN